MNTQQVLDAFHPDYARQHGCAWFVFTPETQNFEKCGGWASIGGEPAFHFQRPQDLPKNITWWTNLTKAQAWSFGKWQNFKHDGFLGPEWLTLMGEWGQPQNVEQMKAACASWSEILARTAEWLSRWASSSYEKDDKASPAPVWSWGEGDLTEALASRFGLTGKLAMAQKMHPVLTVAFVEKISLQWPSNALQGFRKIVLSLPRYVHAQKILSSRYPVGSFTEVPQGEAPEDMDKRWAWLAQQQLPMLVRFDTVTFKEGKEDIASLWWGTRGMKFSGSIMEPVWMTSEEALEMSEYIDAYPQVFLRGERWERTVEVEGWVDIPDPVVAENSIVAGLLLESLWRSMATPVRTSQTRFKTPVTSKMLWLRAVDRRECFRSALHMQKNNFTVLSYGAGTVTVAFDPESVMAPDWQKALNDSGLRTPFPIAPEIKYSNDFNAQNSERWLKSFQNMELFLMVDRIVFPWRSPDKSDLKPIIARAAKDLADLPAPEALWEKSWRETLKAHARSGLAALGLLK